MIRLAVAGLSVIRWTVMGFAPPVWLLWPLQTLHAFSFAACYLAGLDLVNRMAPKGSESLAQTLNAAYVTGVMMGVSTLGSGPLYDAFAGRGYWVMAAMSGVGFVIALWLYRRQVILIRPPRHKGGGRIRIKTAAPHRPSGRRR